jgi:outer membrane receptor protein involved in Fe transport
MSGSSTYTLAGEDISLPADEISFTYNIYWQSDFKTDLTIYNALQKVKGYAMSGLRIGVQNIADTGVSVSGTVSNLFNRRACQGEPGGTSGGAGVIGSTPNSTFGVPGTSGLVQCVPLPPRMVAATVRYAF